MELVRGIRITDYCEQNHLDIQERLELFIKVCQAIQHAHQKGIIHRDIKPSNILVTLHDGVPVPKVIDFGIAKATEGRLTDATVYTQLHQFIGTPAYMSPEQAEMSGLDIDTRSDIYSLGVLLYELLTGVTPFDGQELIASGIDGMRKTIREKEPLRPSTRLTQLQTTSSKSSLAPRPSSLASDLDWIAMKCLEKDRTRRYETANSLATDLKRHLGNEPVVARPPSTLYRVRKFVRRNKAASLAVAAVAFGLVFGLGFSTYAFLRERQAFRALVTTERRAALERVRFAVVSGDDQRVEQALREAERVGVSPEVMLVLRGYHLMNAGRRREVIELLQPLVNRAEDNVAALGLYATAQREEGRWNDYERLLPRLRAARPVTHEDHLFLGMALGMLDAQAGIALLTKAVQLQDSPMARIALAGAEMLQAHMNADAQGVERALREVAAAEAWARTSLAVVIASCDMHLKAGLFYRRMGDRIQAEEKLQTADVAGRRLESFHSNQNALWMRAVQLQRSGRDTEAAQRLEPWARELPELRHNLVRLLWEMGRSEEAYEHFRQWREWVLSGGDPWATRLLVCLITLDLPRAQEEHGHWLDQILSDPSEDTANLYAAYVILTVRGDLDRARAFARAWRAQNPERMSTLGTDYNRLLRYKCGELADETYIADSRDSAFNHMEAQTYIGLAHLARGDRVKALDHLTAGEATGASGYFLRGILNRTRSDPNWPPKLPLPSTPALGGLTELKRLESKSQ